MLWDFDKFFKRICLKPQTYEKINRLNKHRNCKYWKSEKDIYIWIQLLLEFMKEYIFFKCECEKDLTVTKDSLWSMNPIPKNILFIRINLRNIYIFNKFRSFTKPHRKCQKTISANHEHPVFVFLRKHIPHYRNPEIAINSPTEKRKSKNSTQLKRNFSTNFPEENSAPFQRNSAWKFLKKPPPLFHSPVESSRIKFNPYATLSPSLWGKLRSRSLPYDRSLH